MSSGRRALLRYSWVARESPTLTHTSFIDCDPETTSLTINSVANVEPALAGAAQRRHTWLIPIHKGVRIRSPRARTVTLRYIGALPDGISSDVVVVPVLTGNNWAAYRPGLTGQYRGLPVEVISRLDGVPDITGN